MISSTDYNLIIFGIDLQDNPLLQEKAEFEGYLSIDHMLYEYLKFPKIETFDCTRRFRAAVEQHWLNVGIEFLSMDITGNTHNFIAVRGKCKLLKKNFIQTLPPDLFVIDPTHVLKLKNFCDVMDITFSTPNWYFVS